MCNHFRYGCVTNTKIKFVIVVESSNTSLRDNEIRSVRVVIMLRQYNASVVDRYIFFK